MNHLILNQLYENRRESTDRVMGCQLSVLDILKNLIGGSKCFGRFGGIELHWLGSLCSQALPGSILYRICSPFASMSVCVQASYQV